MMEQQGDFCDHPQRNLERYLDELEAGIDLHWEEKDGRDSEIRALENDASEESTQGHSKG